MFGVCFTPEVTEHATHRFAEADWPTRAGNSTGAEVTQPPSFVSAILDGVSGQFHTASTFLHRMYSLRIRLDEPHCQSGQNNEKSTASTGNRTPVIQFTERSQHWSQVLIRHF
jgi:hypothetical protein